MIPVQFDLVADVAGPGQRLTPGVCAECTKCGKVVKCPYPQTGGPVTKIRAAKASALGLLERDCEHLVFDCVPDHIDRRMPRGVVLYMQIRTGQHMPVLFDKNGRPNTTSGACPKNAQLIAVPESSDYAGGAAELAADLRNRGFSLAVAVHPEFEIKPVNAKKVTS